MPEVHAGFAYTPYICTVIIYAHKRMKFGEARLGDGCDRCFGIFLQPLIVERL